MFGYFRFFLATLVVLSHLDITISGFRIGEPAVACFYILSGYVVTHLLTRIFITGKFVLVRFYFERFLRIYHSISMSSA